MYFRRINSKVFKSFFFVCGLFGIFAINSSSNSIVFVQKVQNDTLKADFSFDEENTPEICFSNKSLNGYSYKWWFDVYKDSLNAKNLTNSKWQSREENPCFSFEHSGGYYVVLEVTHLNGYDKDTVVKEVSIPIICVALWNTFTPDVDGNRDGKKDVFDLPCKDCLFYQLDIYNRYGTKVFNTKDTADDWNGKLNNTGPKAAEGKYFYALKYIQNNMLDTATKYGSLILIRSD